MKSRGFFIFPVCLVALFLSAAAARAEVLEADEYHFVVKHEVQVPLDTQASYQLLGKPSQWWSSAHTWSGDAKNMRLQLKAGGCFCEVWKGNSVVHAQVIHAQPGSLLRMQGAFGPLQDMAVTAVMSYQLKKEPGGTRIEMTYRVSGNPSHKLASLAGIVDKVLGEQMAGFRKKASPT